MKPAMSHTATKQITTRNAYGDYVVGSSEALQCHFRDISDIQHGSSNESVQADAMAWFEADSGIVKGNIITVDGENYIIERLTKARRLGSTTVEFIKCELMKYGAIS